MRNVAVVVMGLLLVLIVGGLYLGATSPPDRAEHERRARECARAVMSSMEAPVVTYADKAAYDARVRERCRGFDLPQTR